MNKDNMTEIQQAGTKRPSGGRKLRFTAPAGAFTESLPLGNGRLGAMLFGGVNEERIVLNESGMWSGSPEDANRPDAAAALPEIRRLLLAGKNAEAEKLVNANFTCKGKGSGSGSQGSKVAFGCYQPLGNLRLTFISPAAAAPVRTAPIVSTVFSPIPKVFSSIGFSSGAILSQNPGSVQPMQP